MSILLIMLYTENIDFMSHSPHSLHILLLSIELLFFYKLDILSQNHFRLIT